MSVSRGDVGLALVPFFSGTGAKSRPVLVVQNDKNNARMQTTIVAVITSNTSRIQEDTQLFIERSTPEGAASGLLHDSAVKAENNTTIIQNDIRRVIGHLPKTLMIDMDECLKVSLGIV